MNTLLTDNLWPNLAALAETGDPKKAAVAYVTNDDYLQFGEGEVLVVDASDRAIQQGSTSAEILVRAFERGASIYSFEHLHAKIVVFGNTTSVGSANASRRSAETLIEASWLSDQQELTQSANEFIDQLVRSATEVDRDFLERISKIEVQNTGSNRYRRSRSHPILLYFQEVLPGDIEKYQTTSALAGTGGGARDLRVRPAELYRPYFEQMFPNAAVGGTSTGTVVWASGGVDSRAIATLHPPTNARPNELRIGRFYDIGSWQIDPDQYAFERDNDLFWFYVLEMGRDAIVSARLLQRQHLDREDPLVAEHLERQLARTNTKHATRGIVDLQNRMCVPEVGE